MEDNNNSVQLDDEDVMVEQEEELEDAEDSEDDFEEEYNWNDEDEDDSDVPENDEAEDDEPSEEDSKNEDPPQAAVEDKPAEDGGEQDQLRGKMMSLLDRLGYHGTYEEAMAAFEADEAKRAEQKQAEAPEEASAPAIDYLDVVARDLRDINAAFGTQFRDYSGFDDLERFATLRAGGATALEAFRATQRQFAVSGAVAAPETPAVPKPSIDHIAPIPRASAAGASDMTAEDRETLAGLRELYPELSKKELAKTLHRVKKAR